MQVRDKGFLEDQGRVAVVHHAQHVEYAVPHGRARVLQNRAVQRQLVPQEVALARAIEHLDKGKVWQYTVSLDLDHSGRLQAQATASKISQSPH